MNKKYFRIRLIGVIIVFFFFVYNLIFFLCKDKNLIQLKIIDFISIQNETGILYSFIHSFCLICFVSERRMLKSVEIEGRMYYIGMD
jgi:hypothetical protein